MPYVISEPSQIPRIRRLYATLNEVGSRGNMIHKYAEDRMLLAALAKSDSRGEHEATYAILPGLVSQIQLPEKGTPSPPKKIVDVDPDHNGPFKNTKPSSFRLGGWVCMCAEWRDVVQFACQILYHEHTASFEACVLPWIRGPRRGPYFSRTNGEFKQQGDVGGSIYVDTRLSANNSVSLVRELCTIFGYSPADFHKSVAGSIR